MEGIPKRRRQGRCSSPGSDPNGSLGCVHLIDDQLCSGCYSRTICTRITDSGHASQVVGGRVTARVFDEVRVHLFAGIDNFMNSVQRLLIQFGATIGRDQAQDIEFVCFK